MVYLPSMEGKLKAAELLAWRKKRSLTRRELADALGTTVTAVYRWETAARKIPPFLHLALKWLEKEGGETMKGSIQKKGNAYYVVFWVRDPETDKQKQKWIKAGSTRKEAEAKYVELAPEANERTYKELKKATFEEFSKIWLKSYAERRTKPSTTRSYRDAINNQFVPRFGKMRLTEIDFDVIQAYLNERETEVKPKTVINEIVPLKLMFKHAVRWGYLKSSPAEYVERG